MSNTVSNSEVVDRFKFCKGNPTCHVSDVDSNRSDVRAKGTCIACKKRTNWHCILCRNFTCHDTTNSSVKHVADVNMGKNWNRITAVKSCFIHCHSNHLQTSGHKFSLVFHSSTFVFNFLTQLLH